MHTMKVNNIGSTYVEFKCAVCELNIGFSKPGEGAPNVTLVDGQWALPEDYALYLPTQECTLPQEEIDVMITERIAEKIAAAS